jgi:hypothetical protein
MILDERTSLLARIDDLQAECNQMRNYLELTDTQDPRDVVELFDKLNFSVRNSCILASRAVLKSVQLDDSWTTWEAADMEQLQMHFGAVDVLILSEKGEGRRAEDFLPEAFRYVVNLTLVKHLFALFHPEVSEEQNRLLGDMYRNIRCRGWLFSSLI